MPLNHTGRSRQRGHGVASGLRRSAAPAPKLIEGRPLGVTVGLCVSLRVGQIGGQICATVLGTLHSRAVRSWAWANARVIHPVGLKGSAARWARRHPRKHFIQIGGCRFAAVGPVDPHILIRPHGHISHHHRHHVFDGFVSSTCGAFPLQESAQNPSAVKWASTASCAALSVRHGRQ
jgi:hypothetical protein